MRPTILVVSNFDYENMVTALRLNWLRRIVDDNSFWKLYLNDLLSSPGGLFVFTCYYDVDKLNTLTFISELWARRRRACAEHHSLKKKVTHRPLS